MHFSAVQWVMVLGTIGLQFGILLLMVRRGYRSAFPFFFNYVILSLVTFIPSAAVASRISPETYYYLYWSVVGISTLLAFGVIYEVFIYILKPYSALVDLGKLLFKWAIAFLAVVSVITTFAANGSDSGLCAAAIHTIQMLARTSQLMQCGLLLLFVLFETRLGISWRSPAACIILGFGGNSAVILAATVLARYLPSSYDFAMVWPILGVAVYALWFLGFALPQPARRTVQDSPSRLILQRWNEALLASPLVSRRGEVIAMSPVESFLPGVERTVERVMARKMTQ
jgi:hypothetical protein